MRREEYQPFVFAEQAAFTGMRVERGDSDSRLGDAEVLSHRPIGKTDRAKNAVGVERIRQSANGDMGRHEHDFERPAHDHHPDLLAPREIGEQFGMAGIVIAREVDRFLIDRACHQGIDDASLREVHSLENK